jgi:hypothetical protein
MRSRSSQSESSDLKDDKDIHLKVVNLEPYSRLNFGKPEKKAALIIFIPLTVLMTGCDNKVYDSCLRTAEDTSN